MILLTVEEIIELHDKLIDRTGGSHGLCDRNLLESAIYSTVSGFEGYDTCVTSDRNKPPDKRRFSRHFTLSKLAIRQYSCALSSAPDRKIARFRVHGSFGGNKIFS